MSDHPVKRAAALAGGYEGLAKHLGVTKGAVHQWTDEGRQVPAEHCPAIERITNGAVTCEELNDKVDWAFVRASRESAAPAPAPSTRKPGKPKAATHESHPEAA